MTPKSDYHRATPEPLPDSERKSPETVAVIYILLLGAIVIGVMLLVAFVILPAVLK